MKITANQNLIPYFQPRQNSFPAGSPDGKQPQGPDSRAVSQDSMRPKEQAHRYYVDENHENQIYDAKKTILSPYTRTKGIMVDVYA